MPTPAYKKNTSVETPANNNRDDDVRVKLKLVMLLQKRTLVLKYVC